MFAVIKLQHSKYEEERGIKRADTACARDRL